MSTAVSTIERVRPAMGTTVCLRVVGDAHAAVRAIGEAYAWFGQVEASCSRFDASSELSRVVAAGGAPVAVSPLLFEPLRFALAVAESSGGAFDPTVGAAMLARGHDRAWRDDARVPRVAPTDATDATDAAAVQGDTPTWRDVILDAERRTVRLARPLALDLGAVAKGLAVDLAARALSGADGVTGFVIDAGGDLLAAGHAEDGAPWRIGVRHPRQADALLETLTVRDAAVCTSGDYARPLADGATHLVDPRTGRPAGGIASATVIAPQAMVADALATAAAVLGAEAGIAFLEAQGVEGLLVTAEQQRHATRGWTSHAAAA